MSESTAHLQISKWPVPPNFSQSILNPISSDVTPFGPALYPHLSHSLESQSFPGFLHLTQ